MVQDLFGPLTWTQTWTPTAGEPNPQGRPPALRGRAGLSTDVPAIILIVVVELLTLFAVVGLTFTSYADRAVPKRSEDGEACDIVMSVLDERGDILDSVQARAASGEMMALRYRGGAEAGATEAIRATIRSRTVPRSPPPTGPAQSSRVCRSWMVPPAGRKPR